VNARAEALFGPASTQLPRLLAGLRRERPLTMAEHVDLHGPLPRRRDLIDAAAASGLGGRGGAGFPTGRKLAAVASARGGKLVLANGTEGEPVSDKDKTLLRCAPQLVLDGAVAAADAIGAREAVVTLSADALRELAALEAAIAERRERRVRLEVLTVPSGFVSGEETALVNRLGGGPAKPTFVPPRPFERGILVQNVETLAQLALVARYGPHWFRGLGSEEEPGSALVTITGAVVRPGVYEVALGERLDRVLGAAGGPSEPLRALLVGGYFGGWVDASRVAWLRLLDADLRAAGASLGARAIVALPASADGLGESARIARYLAAESAGQCGACVNGLAAIAGALERLAAREPRADDRERLERWLVQIRGRGACRHPDGAAGFVASTLRVFAEDAW
jgi:NADH:ubiquinone oxidoreductase subunit F (NADH-binding)